MSAFDTKEMLTSSLNKKLIIVGIILLLAALVPSFYFYNKFKTTEKLLQTAQTGTASEAKALIEKIDKLMVLPADEEPTVATVTDLEKLKDQPFFSKAKVGDKLLVYQNAKKAILYDPVANKIVEVGPVNIGSPSATQSPPASGLSPTVSPQSPSPTVINLSPTITSTISSSLRVFLYNGTTVVGLTKKVEDLLKEKMPDAKVVDRDNAAKKDYAKTLVIDLKGNNKDDAQKLAKAVGGEISSLPAGESKPEDSDFLIIVGADKK